MRCGYCSANMGWRCAAHAVPEAMQTEWDSVQQSPYFRTNGTQVRRTTPGLPDPCVQMQAGP